MRVRESSLHYENVFTRARPKNVHQPWPLALKLQVFFYFHFGPPNPFRSHATSQRHSVWSSLLPGRAAVSTSQRKEQYAASSMVTSFLPRLFRDAPSIEQTLKELEGFSQNALAPHVTTVITGLRELKDDNHRRGALALYNKLPLKSRTEHADSVADMLGADQFRDAAYETLCKLAWKDLPREIAKRLEAEKKRRQDLEELSSLLEDRSTMLVGLEKINTTHEAVLVPIAPSLVRLLSEADEDIVRRALMLLQHLPPQNRSKYAEAIDVAQKKCDRLARLRSLDDDTVDSELSTLLSSDPSTLGPYASAVIALLDSSLKLSHVVAVVSRSEAGRGQLPAVRVHAPFVSSCCADSSARSRPQAQVAFCRPIASS